MSFHFVLFDRLIGLTSFFSALLPLRLNLDLLHALGPLHGIGFPFLLSSPPYSLVDFPHLPLPLNPALSHRVGFTEGEALSTNTQTQCKYEWLLRT